MAMEPCVVCQELCTPWMWFASEQGHVCQECAHDLWYKELKSDGEYKPKNINPDDICS